MFYEKIPEQPERFLSIRQIGILEEILEFRDICAMYFSAILETNIVWTWS